MYSGTTRLLYVLLALALALALALSRLLHKINKGTRTFQASIFLDVCAFVLSLVIIVCTEYWTYLTLT